MGLGDNLKENAKKLVSASLKTVAILVIITAIILGLLGGSTYVVKKNRALYQEGEESNVPYVVDENIESATIDDDGVVTLDKTAEELWDELIENDSYIDDYLDDAEALNALMKAELITNYLDTRENPDEEIDWDTILESDADSNVVQGIIKLKRETEDETTYTMTYVDSDTFYIWLEDYNINGSEDSKQNLLSHFTLGQTTTTTASDITLEYNGTDQWTDISEAIVTAAFASYYAQNSPGAGYCQAWVRQVYADAGLGNVYYGSAIEAFKANVVSTDSTNIPIGAAVYGTGSNSNSYGHVGIYIGDYDGDGEGDVMDNVGTIRIQSLSEWIAWQEAAGSTGEGYEPGWLGWGWQAGSPSYFITDEDEIAAIEARLEVVSATTTVTATSGANASTSSGDYYAIVATWAESIETVESDDPDVETGEIEHTYTMTTTKINYQNIVSGYTMPFDYLWAWLVYGNSQDFVLELADLVYNSEIEITVYDNLTTVETVSTDTYTKKGKVTTENVEVQVTYTDTVEVGTGEYDPDTGEEITEPKTVTGGGTMTSGILGPEEPSNLETDYTTITTLTTYTNTLNIILTKADVWLVYYSQEYEYDEITEDPVDSEPETIEDEEYADEPDYITYYSDDPAGLAANYAIEVASGFSNHDSVSTTIVSGTNKYYFKTINREINTTTQVYKKKYTSSPATIEAKVDPDSDEPNFVTIYLSYKGVQDNIEGGGDEWLFEVLEENDKTKDLVDVTKYFLYMATNNSRYYVEDTDFDIFYPGNYSSVSGGTSGITDSEVAAQIYDYFLEKGMPAVGIAAMLGNIEAESSFDPAATNASNHRGLCQWDENNRWPNLCKLANDKGTDWTDVETQCDFIWQELNTGYTSVLDALMNATTEDDLEYATWYFGRYYEVFFSYSNDFEVSKSATSKRYEYAQKWYNKYLENNS